MMSGNHYSQQVARFIPNDMIAVGDMVRGDEERFIQVIFMMIRNLKLYSIKPKFDIKVSFIKDSFFGIQIVMRGSVIQNEISFIIREFNQMRKNNNYVSHRAFPV